MAGFCNLLCFITIAVAFNTVTATDYCNLASCLDEDTYHTMCIYSLSTSAAACGRNFQGGLTNDDKSKIVVAHNQLRQKVASGNETRGNPGPQPAAVSMPDLTWDDELEAIAQRWANQCNFDHKCRNVDRFAVGQNIAATYYSNENNSSVTEMVQSWYDEVANFNRSGIDSYVIGCGRMKFRESNKWNVQYLVCNYGPAGNRIGEPIYEVK